MCRCVPGMHPRLRWSRSVREKRALLMGQNQQRQQLWQRDRRRRNKKGQKAKKRGQKGKGGNPIHVQSEISLIYFHFHSILLLLYILNKTYIVKHQF